MAAPERKLTLGGPIPGAERLPQGIYLIPVPTPFPVGPMNAVLLKGEPLTLVDCGPRYQPAAEALEAGLAAHGLRVEDIELLVLTHFHADHAGLAPDIRRRSGCRVLAHPNTAIWLQQRSGVGRADSLLRLFLQHGGPTAEAESVGQSAQAIWQFGESMSLDGHLNEGDTLLAGSRTWQVLHTPGHAYGHITLWDSSVRGAIAGDHLIQHISSNAFVDPVEPGSTTLVRSLPLYLESLLRVAALAPDWVISSHGAVITDARGLVSSRLMRTERRLDHIRKALRENPATAYSIMRRMFPKLSQTDLFLGLSEVLGHLLLLEDRGEAVGDGEPVLWRLR